MLRIFALSLLILLFSCSDDSGIGPDDNGRLTLGTFRVEIDGTKWEANLATATFSTVESYTVLGISAAKSNSSSESQGFAISIGAAVGNISALKETYAFGDTNTAVLTFTVSKVEGGSYYYSSAGQVKINNITETNVSGEFNATCINSLDPEDTIIMTNGAFNAPIYLP